MAYIANRKNSLAETPNPRVVAEDMARTKSYSEVWTTRKKEQNSEHVYEFLDSPLPSPPTSAASVPLYSYSATPGPDERNSEEEKQLLSPPISSPIPPLYFNPYMPHTPQHVMQFPAFYVPYRPEFFPHYGAISNTAPVSYVQIPSPTSATPDKPITKRGIKKNQNRLVANSVQNWRSREIESFSSQDEQPTAYNSASTEKSEEYIYNETIPPYEELDSFSPSSDEVRLPLEELHRYKIPLGVTTFGNPAQNVILADRLYNPTKTTNVYIRGLHPSTTDASLYNVVRRYGPTRSVKAIVHLENGECKG